MGFPTSNNGKDQNFHASFEFTYNSNRFSLNIVSISFRLTFLGGGLINIQTTALDYPVPKAVTRWRGREFQFHDKIHKIGI